MNAPMNGPQGNMHPEDKRNMIVFFAMCIIAFLAYDHFVSQPRMKAIEAKRAEIAKTQASTAAPKIDDQSVQDRGTALSSTAARLPIRNDNVQGTLNARTGRIDDLSLTHYSTAMDDQTPVALMNPAHTDHPLYMDFGFLTVTPDMRVPDGSSEWHVTSGSALEPGKDVAMSWDNGHGVSFGRTYAIDDQYVITTTHSITNHTNAPVTLRLYSSLTRHGLPADFEKSVVHQGPVGYFGKHLEEVNYVDLDKKKKKFAFDSKGGWTGYTDKYWFTGLIAPKDYTSTIRFTETDGPTMPIYQIDMTTSDITVAAGATTTIAVPVFAGPKQLSLLNAYSKKDGFERLDLAIDFGKFWLLTIPFYKVLTWLGHATGSFAIALLLFTLVVRACVFPLANKSYRSFARMRKIQPRMLEIREKYGEDRAQLQKEIFALYKKEQVNPMAGCLPLLIQIPIFFSLYKTLYISLEMRHAPFFGWIKDMSVPDPYSVFTLFGLIDWNPPQLMHVGIWPIIMGITLFMQQRLNPPSQDPAQARILQFMPVMITLLMAHFPAGLVIYWSWSNCLSILQQYILMKKEGVEVRFFTRSPSDKHMAEVVAEGPDVHPAEEEIKEDLEAIEGKVLEKTISPPKPSKKR